MSARITRLYLALLAAGHVAHADAWAVLMHPTVPVDIGDELQVSCVSADRNVDAMRGRPSRSICSRKKTGLESDVHQASGIETGNPLRSLHRGLIACLIGLVLTQAARAASQAAQAAVSDAPSDGGRGEFVGDHRLWRSGSGCSKAGYDGGGDNGSYMLMPERRGV